MVLNRTLGGLAALALIAAAPVAAEPDAPFGGAIGGPFLLTDHTGAPRGEVDPEGRPQLLFFGYAECPGICSHALPTMALLADRLGTWGIGVTPVLVTIDPDLDTVDTLAAAVPEIHPDMVGLTGSPEELAAARDTFHISIKKLFEDPNGQPVYAHGSYIYLLDSGGDVLTLLPPILGLDRMEEIVLSYLDPSANPSN